MFLSLPENHILVYKLYYSEEQIAIVSAQLVTVTVHLTAIFLFAQSFPPRG